MARRSRHGTRDTDFYFNELESVLHPTECGLVRRAKAHHVRSGRADRPGWGDPRPRPDHGKGCDGGHDLDRAWYRRPTTRATEHFLSARHVVRPRLNQTVGTVLRFRGGKLATQVWTAYAPSDQSRNRFSPSRRATSGSKPSCIRAFVISGQRRLGSSAG